MELVWRGETLDEVCSQMGYKKRDLMWHLNGDAKLRGFIVDVSMVARAREELLGDKESL